MLTDVTHTILTIVHKQLKVFISAQKKKKKKKRVHDHKQLHESSFMLKKRKRVRKRE